jgi:hypothetical protein
MLQHELLRDRGILILKPEGALTKEDFSALASLVDPYIEQQGELKGILIDAKSFPGWEDFQGLLSHLRFVRDHHRRIRRIAIVSDSKMLAAAPKIASHFVGAKIRSFEAAGRTAALEWLESA